MTDHQLDRLARILSGSRSRRQTLAALGALAAARLQPAHAATQIAIPACGEAGAVCTLIHGCCSGFVCATSQINPSYGVCVAGAGGMLPVSDSLVVPTGDGVTEELAQQVTAANAATTSAQAFLDAKDAEIQARKDARNARESARRTRIQTNRTTQRTNKDTRRATRQAEQTERQLDQLPQLTLEFDLDAGESEIVRVRNHERVSVVLSRIESIKQPEVFSTTTVTIPAGGTHLYESDSEAKSSSGVTVWTKEDVCPDTGDVLINGDGIHLTAAQSGGDVTHLITVLCGQSVSTVSTVADTSRPRKKKRRKQPKRGTGR